MKSKFALFLLVCVVAYIGISFMEGSGSVPVRYNTLTDSSRIMFSLPPEKYYESDLVLPKPPRLKAYSAIVVDNRTNQILYQKKADVKRPIASITKLLAALVLVETEFDLTSKIKISRWDARTSSSSRLKIGEKFLAKDLFYAALIASDNRAIRALARSGDMPYKEFVKLMNKTAKTLGLDSTRVVDPSGIYSRNISTASDCARLLNYALRYPIIRAALSCRKYEFRSLNHKLLHRVNNTNRLLKSSWEVVGGKTGYISASGFCLAVKMKDDHKADITTVVLGTPSNNYRFSETRKIASWAFESLAMKSAQRGH
jgi:D-alanyl-D-alanine endopeptidase (penicillin-binding protein 7)